MTRILQTMMAKFWRQKATIRPQNIGLKAAAAKRPHFAHGRCKVYTISLVQVLLLHKTDKIYFGFPLAPNFGMY